MRLRHGGNTEGGNADLAETRQRALSGYKTATIIASSQTEREFWLRSAGRWDAILQVKTAKRSAAKPVHLSGQLPSRLASSDDQDLTVLS
jgi:hypothetical protein